MPPHFQFDIKTLVEIVSHGDLGIYNIIIRVGIRVFLHKTVD